MEHDNDNNVVKLADHQARDMELLRVQRKVAKLLAPSNDLKLLHPIFRGAVEELLIDLDTQFRRGKTKSQFRLFEGYRSPQRQAELLAKKPPVTKAGPWESAHQYGLAADIVASSGGLWSWHEKEDWDFLAERARIHGLSVPIPWDRPHVQHPRFRDFMEVLKRTHA